VARVSSSTRNQNSQDVTLQANRREVEGECGICLCNLQISQDLDAEEEEESEHSDDDDDEDDDDNEEDDDDEQIEAEDKDEHQDEELVWCKARCGVNFHKQCIDQWLETAHAPTCPACRSRWKH
jgi:TATA-binding protein-associated factor Taf7